MSRAARLPSLVALGVVLVTAAACLAFPAVLAVVHHYANFIAVGRSSVKIAALGLYAAAAFGLALLALPVSRARIERLFVRTTVAALCLTALSTLGMAALIAKLNVPAATTFYAVSGGEFSFGHLAHSHLFRPVGSLVGSVSHVEAGSAWFAVLERFFGIPGPVLVAFYLLLGLFAAWTALVSLLYVSRQDGVWRQALALIATVTLIKSLVDGAFLDLPALLGVATLGLLLRRRWLLALPLPFLLVSYRFWFTSEFIPQLLLALLLLTTLLLLDRAGSWGSRRQIICGIAALLAFTEFLYAGARVPFFGMEAGALVRDLPTADTHEIPAGADVYFTRIGATLPEHTLVPATSSLPAFIRDHDAYYENWKESIRIAGTSCDPAKTRRLFNEVRIFTPDGEVTSTIAVEPWIAQQTEHGRTSFVLNSCTPNTLVTLLRGIQTLYPDTPLLFAFVR